nr:imidazole glycerol phosphate synthase subunit HisH [Ardenticatena sp.]
MSTFTPITIVDYGAGNLRTVQRAFEHVGATASITSDPEEVRRAHKLVLPGVGAFGKAMERLRATHLDEAIIERVADGVPLLGICLGLQLLFDESEELGHHEGLHLLPGRVRKFDISLKIPHIGWNEIRIQRDHPLVHGIEPGQFGYFVHSFYVDPADPDVVLATSDYEIEFACICGRGHVMGIQFHPEKSQELGLALLRNFAAFGE